MPARKDVKQAESTSARQVMIDVICGYWASQMIYTVTKLGVPDALGKNALTSGALAKIVGANPRSLHRVLRALVTLQVMAEDRRGRFRLTKFGQTLRSDQKDSLRDLTLMMLDDWMWESWGALYDGVKNGGPIMEKVKGMPLFEYLSRHPEKERVFAGSMAGVSSVENAAIARGYPFHQLKVLADVGGAHGHLLATVLASAKKLKGVLYDLPQVVARAPKAGFITAPGVAKRIKTVGGSFFDSVPKGADAYMMKYVLHDWNDQRCGRILENCRDAMTKDTRLLVIDHVLSTGNGPDPGRIVDVGTMVFAPGGGERTKDEFVTLFKRAGLKLKRVLPTQSTLSIVEAVRA